MVFQETLLIRFEQRLRVTALRRKKKESGIEYLPGLMQFNV